MGYALAFAPCVSCGIVFGFNPLRVPSFTVKGVKEPCCGGCLARINIKRKEMGLEAFVAPPDAYEPVDEFDL